MLNVRAKAKMGIVQPMLFPQTQSGEGPIYETIEKIVKDSFFECIEISWNKDSIARKKVANLLKMAQMDVVYTQGVVAYAKGLNPHSLVSKKRKQSVQKIKKLIDSAFFFDARIFQMIGGPDPGLTRRQEAKKYFIDSLCELCEYASHNRPSQEMMISIENLDRDIHKKFLIGPTSEAVDVIQTVKKDFPNIGLTLDLAHLPLLGESFEDAVMTARDHLVHVHLGNCILKDNKHPRYGDTHPPLGIEGGEIGIRELTRFLRALAKIGFFEAVDDDRPIVSFEIQLRENELPEVVVATTKRIFFQACSRAFGDEK